MKRLSITNLTLAFVLILAGNASAIDCDSAIYANLRNSEVFLYYAMAKGNSYSELSRAEYYLKLAEDGLVGCQSADSTSSEVENRLSALKSDIESRKEIGIDNLNYRYPLYDVLIGKRTDYNLIDDTHELLLESVLEQMITQPDPTNKGLISNLGTHALILGNITEPVTYNVMVEFLSEHTNHYVFQLFELERLGYSLDELSKDTSVQELLCSELSLRYGFDELNLFVVNDLAHISEDHLYYSSCQLDRYYADDSSIRKFRYVEGFRTERNALYSILMSRVSVALLCLLLALWLLSYFMFEQSVYQLEQNKKFSDILQGLIRYIPEFSISVFTAVIGFAISMGAHYFLSDSLASPTSYYGEGLAKLSTIWVVIGIPLVTILVVAILSRLRNVGSGYHTFQWVSFIIGVSLVMLVLASLSFFKAPADFYFSKSLFCVLIVSFSSSNLCRPTKSLNKMINEHRLNLQMLVSLVIIICTVLQMSVNQTSWPLMMVLLLVAVGNVFWNKLSSVIREDSHVIAEESKESVSATLLQNCSEFEQKLNTLLQEDSIRIWKLTMPLGSGKTMALRHIKDKFNLLHEKGGGIAVMGDCDKVPVDEAPYEPLREAFGVPGLELDNLFHESSSDEMASMIGKLSLPIPGEYLKMGLSKFSDRTPEKIARQLLDHLLSKGINNLLLIIDDYHLIDKDSSNLLDAIIKVDDKSSLTVKLVLGIESGFQRKLSESLRDLTPSDLIEFNDNVGLSILSAYLKDFEHMGYKFSTICMPILEKKLNERNASSRVNLHVIGKMLEKLIDKGELGEHNGYMDFTGEPEDLCLDDFAERTFDLGGDNEKIYRQILQCAACMGRTFDKSVIAAVLSMNELSLLDDLNDLEKIDVIRDEPELDQRYSFVRSSDQKQILTEINPISNGFSQKKRDYHKAIYKELKRRKDTMGEDFNGHNELNRIYLNQLCELGKLDEWKGIAESEHRAVFNSSILYGNMDIAELAISNLTDFSADDNLIVEKAEFNLETKGSLSDNENNRLLNFAKSQDGSALNQAHILNLLVRSVGSNRELDKNLKKEKFEELKSLWPSNISESSHEALRWRFNVNYFIDPSAEGLKFLLENIEGLRNKSTSHRQLYREVLNTYGSMLIDGSLNTIQNIELGLESVENVLLDVVDQFNHLDTVDALLESIRTETHQVYPPNLGKTLAYSFNYLGRGYESIKAFNPSEKYLTASLLLNYRINDRNGYSIGLSTMVYTQIGLGKYETAFKHWDAYIKSIPRKNTFALLFGLDQISQIAEHVSSDSYNEKINFFLRRLFEEIDSEKLASSLSPKQKDVNAFLEQVNTTLRSVDLFPKTRQVHQNFIGQDK